MEHYSDPIQNELERSALEQNIPVTVLDNAFNEKELLDNDEYFRLERETMEQQCTAHERLLEKDRKASSHSLVPLAKQLKKKKQKPKPNKRRRLDELGPR